MKSSKLHVSWSVHALTKRLLQEPQAPSPKLQAPSSKLQAPRKIKIDMKDNVGYIVFRTAASDPAVIGNGNGPLWDQLNASPPRPWKLVRRYQSSWWGRDPGASRVMVFYFSLMPKAASIERQASSPKHKGSSFKPQASSSKILEPGYR